MLTGVSLRKVIDLVGHAHGTRTKELAKVIRRLGYDCGDRLRHVKDIDTYLANIPRALVKLTITHYSSWHWLAWADGQVFDPSFKEPLPGFDLFRRLLTKPTSYLEISSGTGWAPMRMIKLGEAVMWR